VGGLAEGIAFSPDGRYLYVGNFVDGNIDILRVDADTPFPCWPVSSRLPAESGEGLAANQFRDLAFCPSRVPRASR